MRIANFSPFGQEINPKKIIDKISLCSTISIAMKNLENILKETIKTTESLINNTSKQDKIQLAQLECIKWNLQKAIQLIQAKEGLVKKLKEKTR